MKKLKKSVKAIIISLSLVVVLAGSIFGVVLSSKKDGDQQNNQVTTPPAFELTQDQKELVESVKQNSPSEIK